MTRGWGLARWMLLALLLVVPARLHAQADEPWMMWTPPAAKSAKTPPLDLRLLAHPTRGRTLLPKVITALADTDPDSPSRDALLASLRALKSVGPGVVEEAARRLQDPGWPLREETVLFLGAVGAASAARDRSLAIGALKRLARHDAASGQEQRRALEALPAFGEESTDWTMRTVVELLDERHPALTRMDALMSLQATYRLVTLPVVRALADRLRTERDPTVRQLVAGTLGMVGTEHVEMVKGTFALVAADPRPVPEGWIVVIHKMGDRAVGPLGALLADPRPLVRRRGAAGLRLLGPKAAGMRVELDLIMRLDEDPIVQAVAREALVALGPVPEGSRRSP